MRPRLCHHLARSQEKGLNLLAVFCRSVLSPECSVLHLAVTQIKIPLRIKLPRYFPWQLLPLLVAGQLELAVITKRYDICSNSQDPHLALLAQTWHVDAIAEAFRA
jgi:hypothetical protein